MAYRMVYLNIRLRMIETTGPVGPSALRGAAGIVVTIIGVVTIITITVWVASRPLAGEQGKAGR